MSEWPSTKARRVLTALLKVGWQVKRQTGSHRTLSREGWPDVVFAFHDREEIGPRMLARIAKRKPANDRLKLTVRGRRGAGARLRTRAAA
jgi:predicted RNA binding protein YcfA (HicA-like mRNA interferase family)